MKELLIATYNVNKMREIAVLLRDLPVTLKSCTTLGMPLSEVVEDGTTFIENAVKKALATAQQTNMTCIADDSGLCIEALGGRPGVFSARYAGGDKNDSHNRQRVLAEMTVIPAHKRQACFKCAIALAEPGHLVSVVEGTCTGFVSALERGTCGFGYDSIFYFPAVGKTFAEMQPEEKNQFSHRARALAMLKGILRDYLEIAENT